MNKKQSEQFRIDSHCLEIDQIFVEYIYPVLFTCIDESDNLYIVACYSADAEKAEWIIAETSPEDVIKLLTNKLSIREMFMKSVCWTAIQYAGAEYPTCTKTAFANLDPKVLPTAGEYMDADPDEFDEEIKLMKKRERDYCGETVYSNVNIFVSIATLPFRFDTMAKNEKRVPYQFDNNFSKTFSKEVSCFV